MRTIILEHDYPTSPQNVWNLAIDFDALKECMEGKITFEGLPSGQVYAGQHIKVEVSLFGILPKQPYEMNVLKFDDQAMTFTSSERGSGVKSWIHTLRVVPFNGGAKLIDHIEIQASLGFMTPLFALWARVIYRARHQPRLRILEREHKLNEPAIKPIVNLP